MNDVDDDDDVVVDDDDDVVVVVDDDDDDVLFCSSWEPCNILNSQHTHNKEPYFRRFWTDRPGWKTSKS